VDGIAATAVGGVVEQVAVETAHPKATVAVVESGIDVVVGQRTIGRGIDMAHVGLWVYLIDSLAVCDDEHAAIGLLAGSEHDCPLTTMLPMPRLGVEDADAIISAHQQLAR
jgi:hypothetical protein